MKRSIVLLSGGMDSLVTAAIANRESAELCFLHANYGQRTQRKELWCFERLCEFYRPVQTKVIDLPWLGRMGGSSLTSKNYKSTGDDQPGQIPNTYVPFRNAILISTAVAWAEVIDADSVWIGAVEQDSSGYPDCRAAFFQAMQAAIQQGSKVANIELVTPVINMSKKEIVEQGFELHAPFIYSWSCYIANELACGTCDSCLLRQKAFLSAGISDPIKYKE
ncbi:MAG: 7-cyano-7-deazaguanine synthase QueC [Candidatus Cloacimonetes bacterium]|nr:7-cyano-7-deazaguanine synthase QueC [Candidatus Cloacimonadota bacterium]